MNQDEIYERWKEQRLSATPPTELMESISAAHREQGAGQNHPPPKPNVESSWLSHPMVAVAAVLAASILGLFRTSFALIVGML